MYVGLLGFVGRTLIVVLLYVAAVFLGVLSMGARISTPGDAAQAASLAMSADRLLTGSAAAAWIAGLLWIGPGIDWIAGRKASAGVFLILTIIFSVPQVLFLVLEETRMLSDLRLITWVLAPPTALFALLRLVRPPGQTS